MHKHSLYALLILIPALLLMGCTAKPSTTASIPAEPSGFTQDRLPPESTAAAVSTEGSPEPTTVPFETAVPTVPPEETHESAATQAPSANLPYLLRIDRADQSIYDGPGYDYGYVGTVRERGTYTIVEEAPDGEGNLWGKLKSGIGWVDLTQIHSEQYQNALISANYAEESLLLHGEYHHFPSQEEYAVSIAFFAYGKLQDAALFAYELRDEGLVPGETLCFLPELTPEMPLVAELAFPGDMTTYGIRFTDEAGNAHVYSIYISGRNGALILEEA